MKSFKMLRSPALVALILAIWIWVTAWSLIHIRFVIPEALPRPVVAALTLLYIPWMATWLWTIHNFISQSLCALRPKSKTPPFSPSPSAVALLYTTCDDFDPEACLSGVRQNHSNLRVIICDDSSRKSSRDSIDNWIQRVAPEVVLVRRENRKGFKAGNLNHAIANNVREEFIVVCDADEVLPDDFVARLLGEFESKSLAFVQCRHVSRIPTKTWLEESLGPAIDLFYRFTLPLKNRFGFMPCFGHGMMLRRSAWRDAGGFPEIACEDLGFSMRAAAVGLRGQYIDEPFAYERFPLSYAGLCSKYRRIVAGTIECFRACGRQFLLSPRVSSVEKIDFLITFSSCYLPITIIINIAGAVLLAWLQDKFVHIRPPGWLPVLYLIGPLTPVAPLICQFPANARQMARFAIVGSIAFASLIPVLAFTSIRQTICPAPVPFVPTGTVSGETQKIRDHLWTLFAGLVIAGLAFVYRSAVFIPALTVSLMFLVAPLLNVANRAGTLGWAARRSTLVPYCVFLILWWTYR